MTTHTADCILHALFCLSRDTRPIDATALGRATGHSATQAADALVLLEKQGWVDATRARLTFLGLARALQMDASTGGSGRGFVDHAAVAVRQAPRAPLAAAPVSARSPAITLERPAQATCTSTSTPRRTRTSSREFANAAHAHHTQH